MSAYLIASIVTTLQVAVGLPHQIMMIRKTRNSSGISRPSLLFTACGYSAWAIASIIEGWNPYLFFPNALGGALSVALLILASATAAGTADSRPRELDTNANRR